MTVIVAGPKHRLSAPIVANPWSVVGPLIPPKPPRRPFRRAGLVLLEVFIWLFGSDEVNL